MADGNHTGVVELDREVGRATSDVFTTTNTTRVRHGDLALGLVNRHD